MIKFLIAGQLLAKSRFRNSISQQESDPNVVPINTLVREF